MTHEPKHTPAVLRERYGVPDRPLSRALPRSYLSYKGPGKFAYLATKYSLIAAGCLEAQGQTHPTRSLRPTHAELAAIWWRLQRRSPSDDPRSRRVTITRRLSAIANDVVDPVLATPKRFREAKAAQRVKQKHVLIRRTRQWGQPSKYRFGEDLAPGVRHAEKGYCHPTAAELAAHPRSGHLYDPAQPFRSGGYAKIPDWVFDPRLPINDVARMVFVYYVMCGLLRSLDIHPRQSTVAAALGISVRSVYRANQRLRAVGLIEVVQSAPVTLPDGRTVRGPAHIIYVPLRHLTREQASLEMDRLFAIAKQRREDTWWYQARDFMAKALESYIGKDKRLATIQADCRLHLRRNSCPKPIVDELFPRPPD